jgi:epoxyqueuosine reductase
MPLSLNKIVKPQSIALNAKAAIFSSEISPTKRLYVEGVRPNFDRSDRRYLVKNIGKIYRLPFTLYQTVHLIKNDRGVKNSKITKEVFQRMEQLLKALGVDEYGFFEVHSEQLFRGCGIPHRYALVFSSAMNKEAFKNAPSIECQVEVAKIYAKTGNAANKVAEFLQENGFGASPNHSMGGQLDYSQAAKEAGIGVIGRHSMAITRKNGPCHRISVVYTDIENLSDYIISNKNELEWIMDFCKTCGKCIRKCPTEAIFQAPLALDGQHPTRIDYEKCCQGFIKYGCGVCIKECPFTAGNYEKLRGSFKKSEGCGNEKK